MDTATGTRWEDDDYMTTGEGSQARSCPHGCSYLAGTAGHEDSCPIGRTFYADETHDQRACPECSAYFAARGEDVPAIDKISEMQPLGWRWNGHVRWFSNG